mmetsp:Transcript_14754/g.39133  ORF Transcript_14754/g.39133 Transcript_14754/m.39133 type:complete len:311 (-) Transcript_14754:225-1157(-)
MSNEYNGSNPAIAVRHPGRRAPEACRLSRYPEETLLRGFLRRGLTTARGQCGLSANSEAVHDRVDLLCELRPDLNGRRDVHDPEDLHHGPVHVRQRLGRDGGHYGVMLEQRREDLPGIRALADLAVNSDHLGALATRGLEVVAEVPLLADPLVVRRPNQAEGEDGRLLRLALAKNLDRLLLRHTRLLASGRREVVHEGKAPDAVRVACRRHQWHTHNLHLGLLLAVARHEELSRPRVVRPGDTGLPVRSPIRRQLQLPAARGRLRSRRVRSQASAGSGSGSRAQESAPAACQRRCLRAACHKHQAGGCHA